MVICLERGANDMHMVQVMPPSSLVPVKSEWFTFVVPMYRHIGPRHITVIRPRHSTT